MLQNSTQTLEILQHSQLYACENKAGATYTVILSTCIECVRWRSSCHLASLDELHQSRHHGSTHAPGDWKCQHPSEEDASEQFPVHVLSRPSPADKHHGADLAVCRADWKSKVWCCQYGHCCSELDAETTTPTTLINFTLKNTRNSILFSLDRLSYACSMPLTSSCD